MKISIIIPTYNTGNYVTNAIESVIATKFNDYEIIVVDDGSTDKTELLVKPYLNKNITYLYQENSGLAAARNTGMINSNGKYLVFLDSDDLILPDKLVIQSNFLDSHIEYDVVYSNSMCFIGEDVYNTFILDMPHYSENIFPNLLFGNFIHVNSVMVRKEKVMQAGMFDPLMRELEDWDLWLRMSYQGSQFAYMDKILSKVRIRKGSMTNNQAQMNRAMVNVLYKIEDLLESFPYKYELYRKHYYHSLAIYKIKANDKSGLLQILNKTYRLAGPSFTFTYFKLLLKGYFELLNKKNKNIELLERIWHEPS